MFTDATQLFHPSGDGNEQSLVGAVGNVLFNKSINLGTPGKDSMGNTLTHDPGKGTPIELAPVITTQVDSAGGAATVEFQLVMADNEGLTSNLVVLARTAAIAEAVLVPGYRPRLPKTLPPGITKQFLGLRAVIAGEDVTAGKCFAGLVPPGSFGDAVMA